MIANNLFKLTFPDGWKETTVHTFEGPFDSGVQHNLVVSVLPGVPENLELGEYARLQTESSAGMLPGFKLISEKEVSFFNGIPGIEINYSYQPTDELTFFQKQWYFAISDKLFLFTSTFNRKTVETISMEVEQIIRSLKTDVDSISDHEERDA